MAKQSATSPLLFACANVSQHQLMRCGLSKTSLYSSSPARLRKGDALFDRFIFVLDLIIDKRLESLGAVDQVLLVEFEERAGRYSDYKRIFW
jgi:hypothetical protein